MKYLRLDLLTLLISLFIFSSCEKKGTIGLDIAPQDSIKSFLSESSIIETTTVREDSVLTSGLAQNGFGFIKDPVFGTTEANLAMSLTLPSANLSFGTSPTLDSAVLVLQYGTAFYGDSLTSDYTVNVHQLTDDYNTQKSYYNTSTWNYNSAVIGSLPAFKKFAWRDSINIKVIVDGKPDSVRRVVPQLRIKMDPEFITANFLNGDADNFKTNVAFNRFLKGLYVTINKDASTGNGGLVFLNMQSSSVSGLEVYYKNTANNVIDTNVVVFKTVGSSTIEHDYTGTVVESQLNTPSGTVYVQPMAGLRTKLRFTNLEALKQGGPVSINKAELIIPVVAGTDNPLKPAPRLTLYKLDIAGQRKPVPDNSPSDGRFLDPLLFGGFYDATKKAYSFNITSYIQDFINTSVVQYDTFIAPIELPVTANFNVSPSATTAARSVLGGMGNAQTPIKLRITYTKPN